MGTIDEVKEILNTLRVAMSIAFGILVILVGSLVKRYDNASIDYIFWVGTVFVFMLLLVIVLIIRKISRKTKEIKDFIVSVKNSCEIPNFSATSLPHIFYNDF